MAQVREQWGTRAGFIFAAVGSAIGLGNIWRFPDTAFKAGGGSFLVPYLIALFTAAVPLLIMEYSIGHRNRASPPLAFRRVSRSMEPIGWWQVAISFVIACYYAVILAWAVRYVFFSFTQSWEGAADTGTFFAGLLQAGAPGDSPSLVAGIAIPTAIIWVVTLVILGLGVQKGIEISNRIFIPLLVIVFGALVVWSLTLPGAVDGLNTFFTPDWTRLFDAEVWLLVYGQLFFSLSVGFGIMITYSSYLRRKADLSGTALVAGFSNSSFEILAGIGVFSALGFMAQAQGTSVGEVVQGGVGLAFFSFPAIISELPFGGVGRAVFGVLFFGSLVIAGFSSLISIVQVVVSTVQDRLRLNRVPAVALVGIPMAVISVTLFASTQGLNFLDVADHFINQYGIVAAALISVIMISWLLRKLPMLRDDVNQYSSYKVGWTWMVFIGVLTPIGLGAVLVSSIINGVSNPYGDGAYSQSFLLWTGWAVAVGALLVGIVMSLIPWRDTELINVDHMSKEDGS